jgi:competence protein ComEA
MSGGMSRTQIVAYAALGVVLLLLGARALRAAEPASPFSGAGSPVASEPVGSGGPGPASGDVVVHVSGAVRDPGVYRLPAGSRVEQAVERAGGPASAARADAINLAARLADGQQVVVPSRRTAAAAAAGDDGPISLGSATVDQLEAIDGIGPITAEKIVDFRDQQGGVSAVEDLDRIPGIGPTTVEALSARLQP